MTTQLTQQQFEDGYAARSGVTVDWLSRHGREARPCDCGSYDCEGWQMAYVQEEALFNTGGTDVMDTPRRGSRADGSLLDRADAARGGDRRCPDCKKRIDAVGYKFCFNCGTALPRPVVCCNTALGTYDFCPYCGKARP